RIFGIQGRDPKAGLHRRRKRDTFAVAAQSRAEPQDVDLLDVLRAPVHGSSPGHPRQILPPRRRARTGEISPHPGSPRFRRLEQDLSSFGARGLWLGPEGFYGRIREVVGENRAEIGAKFARTARAALA